MITLLDACVLYPLHIRDLFLRIAEVRLFQAKWSEEILDECFQSLLRKNPTLDPNRLLRTRAVMSKAFPDASVSGYHGIADRLELPDPGDRHVVAAAITCRAQVIVTFNLKDFPTEMLAPYDIDAQHPDDFLLRLIERNPHQVLQVLKGQAEDLKHPPLTVGELLRRYERSGLERSAAALRVVGEV